MMLLHQPFSLASGLTLIDCVGYMELITSSHIKLLVAVLNPPGNLFQS
jgi:hypothetical protein